MQGTHQVPINAMQGFQTILVLNVCQCSKGTHQYHARVSNNISTQCMYVRHSFPKFQTILLLMSLVISTMQGFQTILVLNVCQCSKGTHQYHARVSNNISTQCMSVFQRHSLVTCKGFKRYQYSMYVSVPKALINTMQGFQPILVLNVCQYSKGTHQHHARVSNNISTQCMPVFQRESLVPCKGFKQYQYSMYVSVPKALISNMQGFQTILVLNVCQCSKGTHQYHARVSNIVLNGQCSKGTHQYHRVSSNISTQCMSVFQRHSLVTCKGFKQYQYSMYVSVPKPLFCNMQGFQTILVLNVCQCSKGTHQYHARVSNNISTQCMSVFQRHSLVPCFKQYQYSGQFQTILVCKGFKQMYVCQCSKGTHQYHARVFNIITQSMSMFQRHSLVPCKGFKQYHARVSNNIITQCMSEFNAKGFQTILLVLNSMQVF